MPTFGPIQMSRREQAGICWLQCDYERCVGDKSPRCPLRQEWQKRLREAQKDRGKYFQKRYLAKLESRIQGDKEASA